MDDAPSPQHAGRRTGPRIRCIVTRSSRRWLTLLVASTSHWPRRLPASTILNACLLTTLAVEGLLGVALAIGDIDYAKAVYDSLGDAILFAIAGANFLAIIFLLYAAGPWAATAFIAQAFVFVMAIYVMVIDHRSAKSNPDVMWIAGVIGLSALLWLLILAKRATKQFARFTRAAVLLSALIPLAGSVQFYLQNYYIPRTTEPLVDVSTELSPQSKTSSTIHLSAKVTFHNRGSVQVNVAAALMRLTAYPLGPSPSATQEQEPTTCRVEDPAAKWCQIGSELDLSGMNADSVFRSEPTPPVNAQLLYAELLMPGPTSNLQPGETDTFQREVDMDSATAGLARLSVSALFLTQRYIRDTRSCWKTQASEATDSTSFSLEVNLPHHFSEQKTLPVIDSRMLGSYLCMDYEFAPRNIVDRMIGNQGHFRVYVVLNNPQRPGVEHPQIDYDYLLIDGDRSISDPDGHIANRLKERNPLTVYSDISAEYAPGDPIKTEGSG